MWRVSQRCNTQWGIEGYDAPRKYFDHRRNKEDKEYFALKPGKYKKHLETYMCQRGNYLDTMFKSQAVSGHDLTAKGKKVVTFKYRPGAGQYLPTKTFRQELKEKNKNKDQKLDMKSIRKDTIWQIYHDAKMPDL